MRSLHFLRPGRYQFLNSILLNIKMSVYSNTNGMPMADGKNLHMDLAPGDLANRVITVGSQQRAEKIASFMDSTPTHKVIVSSRGFTTITGYFNGINVSIVSIGMGISMMDFFVRESRAIVEGPMVMVRFGTCGGVSDEAVAGSIVVASKGSGYIYRNSDAFIHNYSSSSSNDDDDSLSHAGINSYMTSNIAPADAILSESIVSELKSMIKDGKILDGVNVTADSFYSSQGRIDKNFNDNNKDIMNAIVEKYPSALSMEMETFMLLHLAKCSKVRITSSAAAIVVANRKDGTVIDSDKLDMLEGQGGKAILIAITNYNI